MDAAEAEVIEVAAEVDFVVEIANIIMIGTPEMAIEIESENTNEQVILGPQVDRPIVRRAQESQDLAEISGYHAAFRVVAQSINESNART